MGYLGRRLALLGWLFVASPAAAATFYVDQLSDDDGACTPGACSLREAALAANALPGVDILELAPGVHEMTLLGINESHGYTGDINFREPVEIRGSTHGRSIVDGNGIDGIFEFTPWANYQEHFKVTDMTLRGGKRGNHNGGAIAAEGGYLDLQRCIFEGNYAIQGGALALSNMESVIRDSTFLNNQAGYGGAAIRRISLGVPFGLLVENTTFSGNAAQDLGGAIVSGGEGLLTIRSSTVVHSSAPFASAIYLEDSLPSQLVVQSTLLEGGCEWPGSTYPPTSLGGNLQNPGSSCNFDHPTDQTVADFGLGPLELSDNGYTHNLLPGSPAIDAAAVCPERDQRGAPRPQDGDGDGVALCDAGAYEAGTVNGLADVPLLSPSGLLALAAMLAFLALLRLR